jgi:hypothetical protein
MTFLVRVQAAVCLLLVESKQLANRKRLAEQERRSTPLPLCTVLEVEEQRNHDGLNGGAFAVVVFQPVSL